MRSVTVKIAVECSHCARPVPLNGPAQVAHCDECSKDTPVAKELPEELMRAHEGSQVLGSQFTVYIREAPEPDCPICGKSVSVGEQIACHGATNTIPCPHCKAGLPTYPAPAWLQEKLRGAVQVFGGDARMAAEQSSLALVVDQNKPEPILMACPGCGGGLTITAEAVRTVRCEYCQANVFLPDELWRRLHPVRTISVSPRSSSPAMASGAGAIAGAATTSSKLPQHITAVSPAFGLLAASFNAAANSLGQQRPAATLAVVQSIGLTC